MNQSITTLFVVCLMVFGFVLPPKPLSAQTYQEPRLQQIQKKLDSLAFVLPRLNDSSNLQLMDVSLPEFVRALGKAHQLNLYIDNERREQVSFAFYGEKVKNILLFLCWKYKLDLTVIGGVLNFAPVVEPVRLPAVVSPKIPLVGLKEGLMQFDLRQDTLSAVNRKIAELSGKSVVNLSKSDGLLSGYLAPMQAEEAIRNIYLMNGYEVNLSENGIFYVQLPAPTPNNLPYKNATQATNNAAYTPASGINIKSQQGKIQISVYNESMEDVLRILFQKFEKDYVFLDKIEGIVTASVESDSLPSLLSQLLRGTKYTFKIDNQSYLVGEKVRDGFRDYKIVKIKYRPSAKIIELIPAALKEGVTLTEYSGLNRIVLFGPQERLEVLEDFILEVDRPIPMVRIEMIVMDININRVINTGLKAGLLQAGDSVSGGKNLLPGLEYLLDGKSINEILGMSGVPFLQSLGTLKSNFYLQIKAMEELGNAEVLTRPMISALNGEEASFTIGETQYFRLLTNTVANGVTPVTQVSEQLQQFQYNTTLTIKPYISNDDMLTLEVHPNFTSPGAQVDARTPPALLKREFNSTIRIKNGETFIMGGLSKDVSSRSTSGIPILARIPVIKWLTGSNNRQKTKTTLLIYITPTIYYN